MQASPFRFRQGFWKHLITSVVSANGPDLNFVFMLTDSKLLQLGQLDTVQP